MRVRFEEISQYVGKPTSCVTAWATAKHHIGSRPPNQLANPASGVFRLADERDVGLSRNDFLDDVAQKPRHLHQ